MARETGWLEFTTRTGCTVGIYPAPERYEPGSGLLVFSMNQPGDGRRAEVVLTPDELEQLQANVEQAIPALAVFADRRGDARE